MSIIPLFPNPALNPPGCEWPAELSVQIDRSASTARFTVSRFAHTVAELEAERSEFVPAAWRVGWSAVADDRYRGLGLGKTLYLIALATLRRLHPDWSHEVSESALNVWRYLHRYPGVRHRSWEKYVLVRPAARWSGALVIDSVREPLEDGEVLARYAPGWQGVIDRVYRWTGDDPFPWHAPLPTLPPVRAVDQSRALRFVRDALRQITPHPIHYSKVAADPYALTVRAQAVLDIDISPFTPDLKEREYLRLRAALNEFRVRSRNRERPVRLGCGVEKFWVVKNQANQVVADVRADFR